MVWQMYIFCHHNTCSFHFCGTKLMYVYCIKRVPRLHQRPPPPIPSPGVGCADTEGASAFYCQPAQWISQPADLFLSNIPARVS